MILMKETETVTIDGQDVEKYLQMRAKGFETLWSGEGKIKLSREINLEKRGGIA